MHLKDQFTFKIPRTAPMAAGQKNMMFMYGMWSGFVIISGVIPWNGTYDQLF